jgi:hypothetical protein
MEFKLVLFVFTKLESGLHGAIGEMIWNSYDNPLLQHSKVTLIDICIHILLRTYLVHIVMIIGN